MKRMSKKSLPSTIKPCTYGSNLPISAPTVKLDYVEIHSDEKLLQIDLNVMYISLGQQLGYIYTQILIFFLHLGHHNQESTLDSERIKFVTVNSTKPNMVNLENVM